MEQLNTPEDISRDLIHFIAKSPSTFHAVRGIKAALLYAGFEEIREEDTWHIEKGKKYVVTRGGTALIAFSIPEKGGEAFHITAILLPSKSRKIRKSMKALM